MYVLIWEYRVKSDSIAQFEQIYHPGGKWAELFNHGSGFLGTEFLRNPEDPQRYITIDRWVSSEYHELFLSQWKSEYEALDSQCEGLTEQETPLGKWKAVRRETR